MNQEDAIDLLCKAGCPQEVTEHCCAVVAYACEIAEQYNERHDSRYDHADLKPITTGVLLCDIGRASSHGIDHAVLGTEIVRSFGLDAKIVQI